MAAASLTPRAAALDSERRCRRCGCTEQEACLDPRVMDACCWVEQDLCSACLTRAEDNRFLQGHPRPSLGK